MTGRPLPAPDTCFLPVFFPLLWTHVTASLSCADATALEEETSLPVLFVHGYSRAIYRTCCLVTMV